MNFEAIYQKEKQEMIMLMESYRLSLNEEHRKFFDSKIFFFYIFVSVIPYY